MLQSVKALMGVTKVGVRKFSRSAARLDDGKLYGFAWGANKEGRLLPGAVTSGVLRPEPVLGGAPIRDIAFGGKGHTAIADEKGQVWMSGTNKDNDLGLGEDVTEAEEPTLLSGISGVKQVACGQRHTAALTEEGDVYTWGWGGSFLDMGALGHGNKEAQQTPKKVEGLPENVVDIQCGDYASFARTADGQIYSWGRGDFGALGQGSSSNYSTPSFIDSLDGMNMAMISASSTFTGTLTDTGILLMWGRNDAGQLAQTEGLLEFNNMEAVPCLVEFFQEEGVTVTDVSCGERHTVVVTDEGYVYEFGNNQWMQPNLIQGDDGFMLENSLVGCGAGNRYSAAIDGDGYLFTWGDGNSCCLGNGSKESEHNPTLVEGFGPGGEFGKVHTLKCGHRQIAVLVEK